MTTVVLIGENCVIDGTLETIKRALNARELIKIKFREYKDEKQSLSLQIAKSTESHVVGMVGHTVILFRQSPDPGQSQLSPQIGVPGGFWLGYPMHFLSKISKRRLRRVLARFPFAFPSKKPQICVSGGFG